MCYIESFIPALGGSASFTDSQLVVASTKISVVVPDSASSLGKDPSSLGSTFASSVVSLVLQASFARVVVKGVVREFPCASTQWDTQD